MQRMGQAARTKAGYYFRVCLKEQHVAMQEMPDPEILRVSLSGPVLDISPFRSFLAEHSQKKQKRTGMTTLGSRGLSSQSVLGFSSRKRPKKPETDWDDKPGKPRFVIPVRFEVFWPTKAKNPKTDWDDNPGKPRLVIPVRFGFFWPKRAKKNRNGLG